MINSAKLVVICAASGYFVYYIASIKLPGGRKLSVVCTGQHKQQVLNRKNLAWKNFGLRNNIYVHFPLKTGLNVGRWG